MFRLRVCPLRSLTHRVAVGQGRYNEALKEIRLDSSSRRSGIASGKRTQFSFRNSKPRLAAIQTDDNFWKYPDDGLVKVFQSGEMDGNLGGKFTLVG